MAALAEHFGILQTIAAVTALMMDFQGAGCGATGHRHILLGENCTVSPFSIAIAMPACKYLAMRHSSYC
jgi:hypothetical protein